MEEGNHKNEKIGTSQLQSLKETTEISHRKSQTTEKRPPENLRGLLSITQKARWRRTELPKYPASHLVSQSSVGLLASPIPCLLLRQAWRTVCDVV